MRLKTLGGLQLEPATFTQPKPLLLLSYLALEGPQPRAHLAELFWPRGESRKSLSMALTRLHGVNRNLVQADAQRVWTAVESDVGALLGALERRDWSGAEDLYRDAFLTGAALGDLSAELEEWVYATREYLAERVQHALLSLAEEAAGRGDFRAAAALAERAHKLPGSGGSDVVALKRLYPLLCAGESLLAPEVRKEAESYGITLRLTTREARAAFKPRAVTLPLRGTSFVGRDVELTELATLLSRDKVSLLTLLGPAGVGKTRLALQLAHEQLSLGAFPGGVYFVPLDALGDASLLLPSLVRHLGLRQAGEAEPLERLTDFIAERSVLLVLDTFEHLSGGVGVLSELLKSCPNLKLLVTTREKLRLEEEYVFPVEGLPYPKTPSAEGKLADAVQLFRERAQQVAPHFNLEAALPDVLGICALVEGFPLGIELAAGWVRLLSCAEIAHEIRGNLDLESTARNVPERHRSLKAAFEASWRLLNPKEQGVLSKLAVFRGGFRRDAAAEVAGATIPLLASLVDKSLLRVLPNGRYDRHPLLYGFTQEKLAERAGERARARAKHAAFYLTLAEEAEPQLQGEEQAPWFARLGEELDNFREALRYLEGDAETALRLATALGYFWRTQGHYTEGYGHLTRLLAARGGSADRTGGLTEAKALFLGGDLAQVLGDHEAGQALLERSLAVLGDSGAASLRAESLRVLGVIAHTNRGDPAGARAHYTSALALARQSGDQATVATVLRSLGNLHTDQANYHEARGCYEEAAALSERVGDAHGRAKTLSSLATVLTSLGAFRRAHALNEQSLALFRAAGDAYGEGVVLLNLGVDASRRGDTAGELEHYRASLDLFRGLGHKHMVSHLLNNLGGALQKRGDLREARERLEESLTLQRAVGNAFLKAHTLTLLGKVLEDEGEPEAAYRCYGECLRLCRETDDNWSLMRVLEALGRWHLGRGEHARAQTVLAEAVTLAYTSGDQKTLIKALEAQAQLALGVGDEARAAHLLARAEKLRQTLDFARMPRYQHDYEEALARVREALGEKRFRDAWAHGQTLDLGAEAQLCRASAETLTPRTPPENTVAP